jgi:hypothetical protein
MLGSGKRADTQPQHGGDTRAENVGSSPDITLEFHSATDEPALRDTSIRSHASQQSTPHRHTSAPVT